MLPTAVIWNWRHGEVGKQDVVRGEVIASLAFGLITVAAQVGFWRTASTVRPLQTDQTPIRSVAVLPFKNEGGKAVRFLRGAAVPD